MMSIALELMATPPYPIEIIRSFRRRTVSISVTGDCLVRVLVPATLAEERIFDLLREKNGWIQEKLGIQQERKEKREKRHYKEEASYTYLGRKYRLKTVFNDHQQPGITMQRGSFLATLSRKTASKEKELFIKQQLSLWYQRHALVHLTEKTERFAKKLKVNPSLVGIKDYKSRWGTCHPDGRIYFNWRIIAAPHRIIDSVVIHELCHLREANHSKRFYSLVQSLDPDFKKSRGWLREHGWELGV